jgi:uncharacterized protein (TIGR02266 family)
VKALRDEDLAQFFRVPIYVPVDYDGREILRPCRITNLSVNGVFIATPKPLPLGTPVTLRFQLPGQRSLLAVSGTVRWSRGSPQRERPVSGTAIGMGVEFDKLSRGQKKAIYEFIRAFIAEMRQRKS